MGGEVEYPPPPKKTLRVKTNNNTPTSLRVNPIFNPMKGSKFIRLITFDPGLV